MTRFMLAILFAAYVASSANADDFARQHEVVMALGKFIAPPAHVDADGFEAEDNIRAIYFDALDYEEKPTKVFAWLGVPEIFATTTPVPDGARGRIAGDATKYNSAAMEVLVNNPKIKINDLFGFTKPNLAKWSVKPNDVHYNPVGRTAQGDEVSRVIIDALQIR